MVSSPGTLPTPTWHLHQPQPEHLTSLQAVGIDPLVARLLVNRGLTERAAAQAFLQPALRDLPDPHLLADAHKAAQIIAQAMQAGKQICVYGDYDVDGVTAAALLHDIFGQVGYPVTVFLPDRMRDGYGLHPERLDELVDAGAQLIISVDCGTTALAEIARVRARGCAFIVVDHHSLGAALPDASALLNPKRPDCAYPDKNLCAVGVALVLAQALRRELAQVSWPTAGLLDLKEVLELAALGTIADVVELHHVNRTLAWHGLRRLGQTKRPGLKALARHLPEQGVAADRVGFVLGPKINAAGRVADARTAFDLLTESEVTRAEDLAVRLDVNNSRRQDLTTQVLGEALAQAHADPDSKHCVVVAGRGWHPGVVGIVAARLREQFGAPAFALAIDDDGQARGSGRSVTGYDLVLALHAVDQGLMTRFGGHAFAAGVTVAADRIGELRRRLVAHAAQALSEADRAETLWIDGELAVHQATLETVNLIEQLEPFGKGNRVPLFLLRDVEVQEYKISGRNRDWVRARLHVPGPQPHWARPHVAAFGALSRWGETRSGDCIDAVIRLERNHFLGKTTVQATVQAVRRRD